MAQAFTHEILSASTNGLGVVVAATATTGTTIHTAIAGTTSRDEIWMWAVNRDGDGETRTLTIEFGGTTTPWEVPIANGVEPKLVIPGLPLRNTLLVTMFADEANDVVIHGYVNRITVS